MPGYGLAQYTLCTSKVRTFPDTASRSNTERAECGLRARDRVSRYVGLALGDPALWCVFERSRVVFWIVMDGVMWNTDNRGLREPLAALIIASIRKTSCSASAARGCTYNLKTSVENLPRQETRNRWTEAHCLVNASSQVMQIGQFYSNLNFFYVFKRGTHFLLKFFPGLRVVQQIEDRSGHSGGRRVRAGDNERATLTP